MNKHSHETLSPDKREDRFICHSHGRSDYEGGSRKRPPCPLKNRIKNRMASSSAFAVIVGGSCNDSVVDAAKTLASISSSSPKPFRAQAITLRSGTEGDRSQAAHHCNTPMGAHSNAPASIKAPWNPRIDAPLLSRTPPSLSVSRKNGADSSPLPAREGSISGPLPGRIGSDFPQTFPQKLMEILSNPLLSNIVTWPHGKGFLILQKRRFATEVMPLYFKHSKLASFTRKLNRWGFSRASKGPDMGAYYHKYFRRANYLLCMQMHCNSLRSQSSTNKASKEDAAAQSKKGGNASCTSSPKPKASMLPPVKSHSPIMLTSTSSLKLEKDIHRPKLDLHMPPPPPPIDGDAPMSKSNAMNAASASSCKGMSLSSIVERQLSKIASGAFDRALPREQETPQGGSIGWPRGRQAAGRSQGGRGPPIMHSPSQPSRYMQPQTPRERHSCLHQLQLQQQWLQQKLLQLQEQQQRQQRQLQQRHQQIQQQLKLWSPPQKQQEGARLAHAEQQQAMAVQRLLGVESTSSRNHSHVIDNTINTLKSSSNRNDQALFTALMDRAAAT